MSAREMTAIHGKWVWATAEDGASELLSDYYVIIDGNTIAGLSREAPLDGRAVIEAPSGLVLPGLINAHNHAATGVITRGLSEDMLTDRFDRDLIYALEMPLADLATEILSPSDISAIIRIGLIELIKSGTTTLIEMFRTRQAQIFDVAAELGLRFYGAPYLFTTPSIAVDTNGQPTYASERGSDRAVAEWRALFDKFDGSHGGRTRVILGPHCTDTCDPALLRRIRMLADDIGCPVMIHLSQSIAEVETIRRQFDASPVEYLESVGLLGKDLLAVHCIHADDDDLDLLHRREVTIVNCPMTYARGGVSACFQKFKEKGIRVLLGTDGYRMDLVMEMQAAGLISKLHFGRAGIAVAPDLLQAVTVDAAKTLSRTDLGVIKPGARADLIVVDMSAPHIAPVADPIKTFVWRANGSNISTVMIDGRLIVEDGCFLLGNEADMFREGSQAVSRLWRDERARPIIERFGGRSDGLVVDDAV